MHDKTRDYYFVVNFKVKGVSNVGSSYSFTRHKSVTVYQIIFYPLHHFYFNPHV